MSSKFVSKFCLCWVGLVLCGNAAAQVNFFECAKNPSKCLPAPLPPPSDPRSSGSESDRARLEEELRQKITAELERREKERLQMKIDSAEPSKHTIDKSIRIATLPHKKALIIGNDAYEYVAKLQNARADAEAMSKSLSNLGYHVTLRKDLSEKSMRAAIRQFKETVNSGDEVLFFYAGHGLQLAGANYLLPTDIKGESEDQVKDEALQLQRLLDDMSEKNAKFTLALIDACRDNPFPRRGRAIGGRGLAPTMAASGQMIIFSAGSGQQALDRLGPGDKSPNGLFTRLLLDEMYAPGTRVDNVVREVRKKVVEAARSIGHEQVPAIYDQVVGDFYFIPPR
jgi:Caspase domain